jgi:hypothetical protein
MDENETKKRLLDLIDQMGVEEQRKLLEDLQSDQGERRNHTRIPFTSPANCNTETVAFSDCVQNISTGGIFIETQSDLAIGEKISVTFSDDEARSISLSGTVAWVGMGGCGIKFNSEFDDLLEKLQTQQ